MGNAQFDRQSIISATTNKQIKIIQSQTTASLAGNGTVESHIFYSPTNTMSTIIGLYIGWNANNTGGITGNRYSSVFVGNSPQVAYFYAQTSVINLNFEYWSNTWMLGRSSANASSISTLPANDAGVYSTILFNMRFDDITPLNIQFSTTTSNSSADANQRTITLFTIQEVVAR